MNISFIASEGIFFYDILNFIQYCTQADLSIGVCLKVPYHCNAQKKTKDKKDKFSRNVSI